MTELNYFLDATYDFNNRILNTHKGRYYQLIYEQSSRKNENINQLDLKFEVLMSDIDDAISNNNSNIDNIISKSNEILNEIPEIVDYKEDYLLPVYKKTKNNSHKLKLLKSRLVMAMSYVFEYGSRRICGLSIRKIEIDNIASKHTKKGTSFTLSSRYGQNMKENRNIVINTIEYNGQEKELDYELIENYSVADIELDSLQKGT